MSDGSRDSSDTDVAVCVCGTGMSVSCTAAVFKPPLSETVCFAAVDKAYKLLLDPEQKKRAVDVINAGKEYVEHNVRGT